MSLRPDGSYRCDRCGQLLENGGVQEAAIVSDLDPDQPAAPRILHLCRKARTGAPTGCVGQTFGATTLANYIETRKKK